MLVAQEKDRVPREGCRALRCDTTVAEAGALMARYAVHRCRVKARSGKVLGELTIHQILHALLGEGGASRELDELCGREAGQEEEGACPACDGERLADVLAVTEAAPSGLLVVDANCLVTMVNPRGAQILGMSPKETLGLPLSVIVSDSELLRLVTEGRECSGRPVRQGERTLLVSTSLLSGGSRPGTVLVFHQLEEMQRQWDAMKRMGDELNSLLENSYDGIIIVDENRILRVNSSFGRITGLAPPLLVGKRIAELDSERHVCLAALQEVVRMSRHHKKSLTVRRSLNSGNEIFVTGSPVFDRHEQVTRVVLNIRDITELKNLEDQIKRLGVGALPHSAPGGAREQLLQEIVAESHGMQQLLDLVIRVAQVDSTVLLMGESGVGKDVIAGLIHKLSARYQMPLISVNCGAIPESLLESEFFGYDKGAFTSASRSGKPGLFEQANGGVLFLDEVSELPQNLQVKLLRVIQDRRCRRLGGTRTIDLDVRILAATNRDLRDEVARGSFREDLFYRLYVVPIAIPPLRERREDILPMALTFLKSFNQKYQVARKLSHELMGVLESYEWPGNVRELQNVVERMVVTADAETLEPRHLPKSIHQEPPDEWMSLLASGPMNLPQARALVERRLIEQALIKTGNTRKAAKLLGITHSTVVRKAQRYGLDVRATIAAAKPYPEQEVQQS
jgi:PAS domain S-box-containing protein